MPVATLIDFLSVKTQVIALWLFQGEGTQFDLRQLWAHMGWPARSIVIILLIMSAWSLGVMMDRWMVFRAARRQSLQFAPVAAGALREGKVEEAILVANRNKRSHLARVVAAGLQEFRGRDASQDYSEEKMETSKRALERTETIVHAEMERGLSGLATIASTAPFVGLLGTVIGIIDAFRQIQQDGGTGIKAVSGGISEALVTTALGLFVAIPAVMMFNYFNTRIKGFDVEMDNSSSEVMDYLARRGAGK
jgi:biopolymer transport protein ExbB/TolQ